MSKFLSPTLAAVTPYTPGEQPQDQQYIKLNTNESPYLPSPAVIAAVSEHEVEKLRLYPTSPADLPGRGRSPLAGSAGADWRPQWQRREPLFCAGPSRRRPPAGLCRHHPRLLA